MLVTLTHHILAGGTVPTVQMESLWLPGQALTILPSFTTLRTQLASILVDGTLALTQILLSPALVLTVAYLTDVF